MYLSDLAMSLTLLLFPFFYRVDILVALHLSFVQLLLRKNTNYLNLHLFYQL
jgi:hypothetical protein